MRSLKTTQLVLGSLIATFLMISPASAGEIKSGLQVGESVPPFKVVKKGGCDDGVALDQSLCYR